MIWTEPRKTALLHDSKTLVVRLAWALSRRMDLGQPIDGYLDDLYYMSNVVFAIEESMTHLDDKELDYLYSIYSKMLKKRNRYKGLAIPAHHNAH